VLLHNTGSDNHWLRIEFAASAGSNAAAIGTRVIVKAGDKRLVRTLWSGSTFGQNALVVHVGLGASDSIDSVTVEWPDAAHTTTTLENVPVDQAILVSQAGGTWTKLW
jgi:hypothetical protein